MPAPVTADDFLELVRKSNVAETKRLDALTEKLRASSAWPADAAALATLLVREAVITQFQSEQLLQGKWRRFHIGKYKVLERLGAGGMGSVYLCEHRLMRRRVAIKVLPMAKADDASSLERFHREARAVAALDHPNIVRAYDIDQDEKLHFLVMEYVDGTGLQEIVRFSGAMAIDRAAHYIRQSALGLQHAHQTAGLVHRDIKPGNILVDRTGTVKILDMGLARFFHDQDDVLTKKYDENVLGTADYLAPEQALDSHNVDIRADIYSLGATFYYLLTGRAPFNEGSVAQKLIWHQTRQPKPIAAQRADVPAELSAIVEKMMAKDPAQRFQMPEDVAAALEPWTQTPIPPPPAEEMPHLSPAALGATYGEPGTRPSLTDTPTTAVGPKSSPTVSAPARKTPSSHPKVPTTPVATPPHEVRATPPAAPKTPVRPPAEPPAPAPRTPRVQPRPAAAAPAPAAITRKRAAPASPAASKEPVPAQNNGRHARSSPPPALPGKTTADARRAPAKVTENATGAAAGQQTSPRKMARGLPAPRVARVERSLQFSPAMIAVLVMAGVVVVGLLLWCLVRFLW